ncbi:MAG TPA: tRNA preQ1(34) S-adenosylmethionine ribosyltransferase-isomerase QueA [Candidatus Acidoferrales bacterium]|nr:tRNA preQ1(34) S-adenosylmethionine ribosyltransferase-isomerase QueA [Candidatus Acidoferrales bacterium]
MKPSELDYHLPTEQIAQRPLPGRDRSRMLLLDRATGRWEDRHFREFPDLLRGNEVIALNNVRVIPARLFGRRVGINAQPIGVHNPARSEFLQTEIEVLLARQLNADTWEGLVHPGRKVPTGERLIFGDGELEALVEGRGSYGLRRLRFTSRGSFHQALEHLGHIPLPPYIKRTDEPADRERYQTVFASQGQAIAAPTAGLHFTAEILQRVRDRGVEIVEITLEIGLGTFEPIRTARVEDHPIHPEAYEIPGAAAASLERAKGERHPVLAIGTTVVRALEDAAEQSLGKGPIIASGKAEASILLYPGKPFRVVDQLLTNFHLPRSSLLALVAAFAGRDNILRAYEHAVDAGYRFYSYGDSMLIR